MTSYPLLNENWLLRGWRDIPHALVDIKGHKCIPLTNTAWYVASACTGGTPLDSCLFTLEHHRILKYFQNEGIIRTTNYKGEEVHPYQLMHLAKNDYIKGVQWAISSRCNLSCNHCYLSTTSKEEILDYQSISYVVDELKASNVHEVHLTGGEPFLRKDIAEIMHMLKSNNIMITQIFSNGMLIKEKHLEALEKTGMKPSFMISFDGHNSHDIMRNKPGSEKIVLNTIRMLKERDYYVGISTSMDSNASVNLVNTFELLEDIGIDYWVIDSPKQLGSWSHSSSYISPKDEEEIYTELFDKWISCRPFEIKLGMFFDSGSDVDISKRRYKKKQYTGQDFDCGYCKVFPHIMSDGRFIPCALFSDTGLADEMPNIFETPISEIINNSPLSRFVSRTKEHQMKNLETCQECSSFSDCGMGCRAQSISTGNGTFGKDELTCQLWRDGGKRRFIKHVEEALK